MSLGTRITDKCLSYVPTIFLPLYQCFCFSVPLMLWLTLAFFLLVFNASALSIEVIIGRPQVFTTLEISLVGFSISAA